MYVYISVYTQFSVYSVWQIEWHQRSLLCHTKAHFWTILMILFH